MRIIAGQHRGRRLEAPKGQNTRPTTDRVRESLMSMLVSARGGLDGAVVLDAFAGSGALGLEALSRGASFACFCERDKGAARVVESNVALLGYGRAEARVCRIDVQKSMPPVALAPYDLVFLDPPYALDASEVFGLLSSLQRAGALAVGVVASYEHATASCDAVDEQLAASDFELLTRRTWGDTTIDILTCEGKCS